MHAVYISSKICWGNQRINFNIQFLWIQQLAVSSMEELLSYYKYKWEKLYGREFIIYYIIQQSYIKQKLNVKVVRVDMHNSVKLPNTMIWVG